MRVVWEVSEQDAAKLKAFVGEHRENGLVRYRIKRNIEHRPTTVSAADFWHGVVACLLTTQQRSGPTSPVTKFLNSGSFPLGLHDCQSCGDVLTMAAQALKSAGGIRRGPTIAKQLVANLEWMQVQWWPQVDEVLRSLLTVDDAGAERAAAQWIDTQFSGFGPKQSRNLLQMLGLTRYEIPLDSRVAKWLNKFGFPVKVSAGALGDEQVYNHLSDGIQVLCRRAAVYPCVFDAAVFASFDDPTGWDDLAVIW